MGSFWSKTQPETVQLCDGLLEDDACFMLRIYIYTENKMSMEDRIKILESLQYTHSVYSFIDRSCISLLFNPNKQVPFLRSNVASDIISSMSSEIAMWLTKNTNLNLRMINVNINVNSYEILSDEFANILTNNKDIGKLWGFDNITNELIADIKKS
jgi:hypothetical protein